MRFLWSLAFNASLYRVLQSGDFKRVIVNFIDLIVNTFVLGPS